jgi:PAS domain S-box-containing protein
VYFSCLGSEPLQAVYDYALECAIRLTESKIGYLALVDQDAHTITIPSWTRNPDATEQTSRRSLTCPIVSAGSWADAVRTGEPVILNEVPQASSVDGSYPGNHTDTGRQVNVPIYSDDRLVALIGVAQRQADYGSGDVDWLTHFMERLLIETQARKDRHRREDSETRYRLLVETMNDGLATFDQNCQVTYVNRRFGQLLRYDPSELLGKTIDLFLGEADQSIFYDQVAHCREGVQRTYEVEWTCSDGSTVPTIVSPQPLFDHSGNFVGSFAVLTDISRQKQTERRLQLVNERLEAEQNALTEKNIALKEVLSQIESEKTQIRQQMQANADKIILPLVRTIKSKADENLTTYISLLEDCLADVAAPFISQLENGCATLSPREVEICNMIKSGLSTKEIAQAFATSVHTVHNQRKKIRLKLKLDKRSINLQAYLQSL